MAASAAPPGSACASGVGASMVLTQDFFMARRCSDDAMIWSEKSATFRDHASA
jgi:hypothetical protein